MACFVSAKLMRAQGHGVTLIVSPFRSDRSRVQQGGPGTPVLGMDLDPPSRAARDRKRGLWMAAKNAPA
jgi:hypothetical protein